MTKQKLLQIVLILLPAVICLLLVPVNFISGDLLLRNRLLSVLIYIYILACLSVLVYGCFVIKAMPYNKARRIISGALWLATYPAGCVIWLGVCVLLCWYTNSWHH